MSELLGNTKITTLLKRTYKDIDRADYDKARTKINQANAIAVTGEERYVATLFDLYRVQRSMGALGVSVAFSKGTINEQLEAREYLNQAIKNIDMCIDAEYWVRGFDPPAPALSEPQFDYLKAERNDGYQWVAEFIASSPGFPYSPRSPELQQPQEPIIS